MSEPPPSGEETLSPSLQQYMDEACDRFEVAWKAGQLPRIEDYLGEASGPLRTALLRELIFLEVAYRRLSGEDLLEYLHGLK